MWTPAGSNTPWERSQLKFKTTNNCLRVRAGLRGVTARSERQPQQNPPIVWLGAGRGFGAIARFWDKPKRSPNKMNYGTDLSLWLYKGDQALPISMHGQVSTTHSWHSFFPHNVVIRASPGFTRSFRATVICQSKTRFYLAACQSSSSLERPLD